jgi:hypothetical protein
MLVVGTPGGLWSYRDLLLEGRKVGCVSGSWAVVDDQHVVEFRSGVEYDLGARVWCVATRFADGVTPLVGTEGAHVYLGDAVLESFDAIPTRGDWYTPWGAPPDVRSLTVDPDSGAVLVNVHVGGVWRSGGELSEWTEVVAVDDDTHQVLAGPAGSGLVVIAAAVGFGWSRDAGATWAWTTAGLHDSYCRAVAVGERFVYVTASTGPFTKHGALYRRPVDTDDDAPFVACGPEESFPFNLDTHQLAASGVDVALGTDDGRLYVSSDSADTWTTVTDDLDHVDAVAFVD